MNRVVIHGFGTDGFFHFHLLRSVSYLSGGAGGLECLMLFGAGSIAIGTFWASAGSPTSTESRPSPTEVAR